MSDEKPTARTRALLILGGERLALLEMRGLAVVDKAEDEARIAGVGALATSVADQAKDLAAAFAAALDPGEAKVGLAEVEQQAAAMRDVLEYIRGQLEEAPMESVNHSLGRIRTALSAGAGAELLAERDRLRAALEAEERAVELTNTSDDIAAITEATGLADRLRREALRHG